MKYILFVLVLLLSPVAFSQESSLPTQVTVTELPPEAIPAGTCKQSYSGYLELPIHKKAKNTNFTSQEIGDYVKARLAEGYSLRLYPQVSGRLFVVETCETVKN